MIRLARGTRTPLGRLVGRVACAAAAGDSVAHAYDAYGACMGAWAVPATNGYNMYYGAPQAAYYNMNYYAYAAQAELQQQYQDHALAAADSQPTLARRMEL